MYSTFISSEDVWRWSKLEYDLAKQNSTYGPS